MRPLVGRPTVRPTQAECGSGGKSTTSLLASIHAPSNILAVAMASIETERFTLRPLVRGDANALFATLSDEAQCRYLSRGAFAEKEELEHWLVDPQWNGRSWVAVDRASGSLAGRFVLVPTKEARMSEIGYITVMQWQGRGVAGECVAALVSHAFGVEGQRRLIAEIDAENAASIAVVERLGFTREGWLREHETTHKGLCDMLIYGLLRREWTAPEAFH